MTDDCGFRGRFERKLSRPKQFQLVLTEEGSGDLPFDSCVRADDEGVVEVGAFSDPEFSSDIHGARRVGGEVHVAQLNAGIAGRAQGGAGGTGDGMVGVAPVTMNLFLWSFWTGARSLPGCSNLKVSAACPTKG